MSYHWIASLNDGQRYLSKELITGDKINPWTKVLEYLRKNPTLPNDKQRFITHLELCVNGRKYNSPTKSINSSFYSPECDKFWIFYKAAALIQQNTTGSQEHFVAYSYRLGDYRHFFWVNTKNNFCYSQVINVVKPKTKVEKEFSISEKDIDQQYEKLYGGNTNT